MTQSFEGGLKTALEMLRASDKFRAEIERRLVQQGHDEPTIRLVFDWLDSKRLLDDRRVAERAMLRMASAGSAGTELIRAKLLARGAPESIVEELLAARSEQDEVLAAQRFVEKKIRPNSARISMLRALSSKGFSEDISLAVVNARFDMQPETEEIEGD